MIYRTYNVTGTNFGAGICYNGYRERYGKWEVYQGTPPEGRYGEFLLIISYHASHHDFMSFLQLGTEYPEKSGAEGLWQRCNAEEIKDVGFLIFTVIYIVLGQSMEKQDGLVMEV